MCGIVGAVANRSIEKLLVNGLKHLEYRGYDSAGIATISHNVLQRCRVAGKVEKLDQAVNHDKITGHVGIAHTRWATHGKPTIENAHPHFSHDSIAVVHNGIIENFEPLKQELQQQGYEFSSQTDSEVIAHLIHCHYQQQKDIHKALQAAAQQLQGAFSLAVLCVDTPETLYALRCGSPLVVGVGVDEYFVASDPLALVQLTQQVIYLEEGDCATLTATTLTIVDSYNQVVERSLHQADVEYHNNDLGEYRHYMIKEIHEQSSAIAATLANRLKDDHVEFESISQQQQRRLQAIKHVHIVACGTSYHAGLVAKYWLEDIAQLPCQVEVASEFRYRHKVIPEDTLLVLISQSGETADLLAVLRDEISQQYAQSLAIVNVPRSTLAREASMVITTKAGAEIGVASTKAFTAQLTVLAMLTLLLAPKSKDHKTLIRELESLPSVVRELLKLDKPMQKLAPFFQQKHHAIYLGRGIQYPIALEGALKLKEISYIHAEAYPAGELKHGPLALVDSHMPVIACVPDNALLEKVKANCQEVTARGGELIVFTDNPEAFAQQVHTHLMAIPQVPAILQPIVYTIPLQLLAYHVAIVKGTDVDKPRNLAKSVTVE